MKREWQAQPFWREAKRAGQVMLISVITLSGILISAAGIAGLLMIYQIRGANDAVNSAKAIFAADAGIEAASFCYFKSCPETPKEKAENLDFEPTLDDPSEIRILVNTILLPEKLVITAQGLSSYGKIIRTLEAEFSQ